MKRVKDDNKLRALILAGRRLVRTEAGTLARKRARRKFYVEVSSLLAAYPLNEERKPVCVCPLCRRVPFYTWASAGQHFVKVHLHGNRCCSRLKGNAKSLARHFSTLNARGQLLEHLVEGATEIIFGGEK